MSRQLRERNGQSSRIEFESVARSQFGLDSWRGKERERERDLWFWFDFIIKAQIWVGLNFGSGLVLTTKVAEDSTKTIYVTKFSKIIPNKPSTIVCGYSWNLEQLQAPNGSDLKQEIMARKLLFAAILILANFAQWRQKREREREGRQRWRKLNLIKARMRNRTPQVCVCVYVFGCQMGSFQSGWGFVLCLTQTQWSYMVL